MLAVRMLENRRGSNDGVNLKLFEKDKVYPVGPYLKCSEGQISDLIARNFVQEGAAEAILDESQLPEEEDLGAGEEDEGAEADDSEEGAVEEDEKEEDNEE